MLVVEYESQNFGFVTKDACLYPGSEIFLARGINVQQWRLSF